MAGFSGTGNLVDGSGTNARFNTPQGLTVDQYLNVYVADFQNSAVRKVTFGGIVSTLYQQGGMGPQGLAFSSALGLYAAEHSAHVISVISTSGTSSRVVFAGSGSASYADGLGTLASFNDPIGLVFSTEGLFLFVGEFGNHCIRKITTSGTLMFYRCSRQE
jgi:hypothetical protein